jgi:hypothetical protein
VKSKNKNKKIYKRNIQEDYGGEKDDMEKKKSLNRNDHLIINCRFKKKKQEKSCYFKRFFGQIFRRYKTSNKLCNFSGKKCLYLLRKLFS